MFYSILFQNEAQDSVPKSTQAPECFQDLNLDQLFSSVLDATQKYDLAPVFFTPLQDIKLISYRQEIMKDLDNDVLYSLLKHFSLTVYPLSNAMEQLRCSRKSSNFRKHNYLAAGHLLDFAGRYSQEIADLSQKLSAFSLQSEGMLSFRKYLIEISQSRDFIRLSESAAQLRQEFSSVKYCMLINHGGIHIRKYEGQESLSETILKLFDRFRQDEARDYRRRISDTPYSDHVETEVLQAVAKLYPKIFSDLEQFCSQYSDFMDQKLIRFSREIQFYLSWQFYLQPFRAAGLPFHYPKICKNADHLYALHSFDLALAASGPDKIVTNSFHLDTPEQILVITGPNQGGKTTFARTFGQIHYLSSLGLSIPGRDSALFLFDHIYTHFGREESIMTGSGKLREDLIRLHKILSHATPKSILIFNEIFSSAALSDALSLSRHMIDALLSLHSPAVIVTFLDELAAIGPEAVSMMSTVRENNPLERTFKIIRKPPDGLAYAIQLAESHGLTYQQLTRRLKNESTSYVSE